MKAKKTTLTVEIEYDPAMTDPEGLASAMDRLLETALSTPGIMEDYGVPTIGEFFVAKETAAPLPAKFVLNISGGVLQDVFSSDSAATVMLCDWDTEGSGPADEGIVEISDGREGTRLAAVARCPVLPLADLAGTETDAALKAAGLDCSAEADPTTNVVRRWVIYDPDADALLTTNAYGSYDEACDDAALANDVLVLPLMYHEPPTMKGSSWRLPPSARTETLSAAHRRAAAAPTSGIAAANRRDRSQSVVVINRRRATKTCWRACCR